MQWSFTKKVIILTTLISIFFLHFLAKQDPN